MTSAQDVPCPYLEDARYAEVGWHLVSGGALVSVAIEQQSPHGRPYLVAVRLRDGAR